MGWLPGWLELLAALIAVLIVAGIFFAVVRAMLTMMARLFRGGPGSDGGVTRAAGPSGARPCPDPKCRTVNAAEAKYCARCGRDLTGAPTTGDDGVRP